MHNNKCKPLPELSERTIARFWSHVDRKGPDECWPWTAGFNKYGYPQFGADPINRAMRGNRIAYFLHHGVDPFPQNVLHKCDFKPCCNGAHYFLGLNKDNSKDRDAKGRTAKGEQINSAKLTDEIVATIRHRMDAGERGRHLAKEYGVAPATISMILNRKTWKHVK